MASKINIKGTDVGCRVNITTESGETLLVRRCVITIDPMRKIEAVLTIPVNELDLGEVEIIEAKKLFNDRKPDQGRIDDSKQWNDLISRKRTK